MDLRDTPEEAAFRAEVRGWLDTNLPEEKRGWRGGAQRFDDAFGREWSRKLYEAGYAGLTWPKEYGGAGAPYSFQAIFYEEMATAQAPPHVGVIGLGMAGPTIMATAPTPRRRRTSRRSSRPRRSGARASPSRTRAPTSRPRARAPSGDGDVYVVNGQKVWSSFAHIADFCILVTLSDPEAARYKGLTYLSSTCTRPASRSGRCARSPASPSSTRSSSPTSRCRCRTGSARRARAGRWR